MVDIRNTSILLSVQYLYSSGTERVHQCQYILWASDSFAAYGAT